MKQYKTVNNLLGWITFAIAAFVYCSTIEPTASFWDCPEFITTAYKLEIGHPPGNPFFMLTGNLFSLFASDPAHVAKMINIMSALMSAGCILFLFWTITHLTRKLLCPDGQVATLGQLVAVEGAGLVGALAYTFTDTFWFSAVEGEVYAYSSMFTALVFWLILKWEDHVDEPHSDRWLVLICYLTGLSIGVHLLNLLCLPAIVLVYYYKKNPNATAKGSIITLIISMILVAIVLYGVVPGIVKVGGWFELLFVNLLGLPFNTGLITYIVLLVAAVIWGVYESYANRSRKRMALSAVLSVGLLGIPFYGYGFWSILLGLAVLVAVAYAVPYRKGKEYIVRPRLINTSLLCLLMLMIGYSSYAVIVIRSTSNPPMDQNSPEDIFTLGQYLNREQYGTRPLFYGPAYNSQILRERDGEYLAPVKKEGAPQYHVKEKETSGEKDSYEFTGYQYDYVYAQNMLFPRMYSSEPLHIQAYEDWMGGIKGHDVPYNDPTGRLSSVKMPTQWENLRFFLSYQVNFMYWRYFMWNFAGRQNDIQGHGELEHGNWLSGIPFIDNARLGDQSKLPTELKENKGHNVFYCLPLLLGLIGLFWQAYRGPKGVQQFWIVFFLFFMTGLAIVFYLNQTPLQPRERDYAYAGSFYAFAIWIGLGVAAVAKGLQRLRMAEAPAAALASLVCLFVPIQMASQTWDDHDRSNRYTCRDFGQNYLMSLPEKGNPIIFTNGDNDTFPLWYNQETEGKRTDARVCNLSYLQTDWYIDQMKRPAYDSPSVPISWSRLDYVSNGKNEFVPVQPELKEELKRYAQENPGEDPFELSYILKNFARNPNPELRFIPTDSVVVTIDKEAVRRSGMMLPDSIPDKMHISLAGKRMLPKNELMILEMIANCNWTRPLYMAITVAEDNYGNLGDHFIQEGLASRISPFNTKQIGNYIDTEKMYDNLMNKFKYGGISNPDIYLDETVMRMCWTHRTLFAVLARQLIQEGKTEKARKALEYGEKMIPSTTVPHNVRSGSAEIASSWILIGEKEHGEQILNQLYRNAKEYLDWYLTLSNEQLANYANSYVTQLRYMGGTIYRLSQSDEAKAQQWQQTMNQYTTLFENRLGISISQ